MTRTTCIVRRISKHEAITLTDANGREIAQIRIADSCPTASTTISMRLPEDIEINKPVKRPRRPSYRIALMQIMLQLTERGYLVYDDTIENDWYAMHGSTFREHFNKMVESGYTQKQFVDANVKMFDDLWRR